MDFFYIMGEAEMQFTADEVFAREIPDKVFEQKQNYKKVTRSFHGLHYSENDGLLRFLHLLLDHFS